MSSHTPSKDKNESNLQRLIHTEDTLLQLMSKAKSDLKSNNYPHSKDSNIFCYINNLIKSHSFLSLTYVLILLFSKITPIHSYIRPTHLTSIFIQFVLLF